MAGGNNPNASVPGIVPGAGDNVFQQSSSALTNGLGAMNASVMPGIVPMTMNQYLNPYQDQVVSNTLGRMTDQRNQDLNMVQTQAANAGAFGGARHGLVEAELMDRYHRNMGEAASTMNQQGFNTAAGLSQNRIGQILAGGQGLVSGSNAAFNIGQAVNQGQAQAGMQQQQLMQAILNQGNQQYDTFANYPQQSLATALAGVQGNPLGAAQTQTSRYNPGLFDVLGFGAGVLGGK